MNNNKTTESYLTVALKRLDDLEGAEKVLQKAHALSPQDPFVLINYAVILEAQGKGNIAAELVSALNDITAVIDVDEQASILFSTFQGKWKLFRVNILSIFTVVDNADGKEIVDETSTGKSKR